MLESIFFELILIDSEGSVSNDSINSLQLIHLEEQLSIKSCGMFTDSEIITAE